MTVCAVPSMAGAHAGNDDPRVAHVCIGNVSKIVRSVGVVTGLIWLKQWNCLPNSTWAAANQAAAGLKNGDCGLSDQSSPGDWRLPTRDEWTATFAPVALGCFFAGLGG